MKRHIVQILAAAPLLLAVPAAASAADDPSKPAEAATAPAPGKKLVRKEVCRSVVLTGSRTSKRICRTVDEWVSEQARANGEVLGVEARGSWMEGQDAAAAGPR
ncbi:hypothetical protein [Sphingomonas jaspsi]|uniref:hypothetical protein n=1 Tax=Sphingomonas jaspsi TaxID=392409 RepID=UPI0004B823B6|nr:hypothetical protein [Sphingomonas jaspsi]